MHHASTGMKMKTSISAKGANQMIRRWQGMDVGVDAQPVWLKDMVLGQTGSFMKKYADEIGDDVVLPIVTAYAATVDEAEAIAEASVDFAFARELSTRVNALVETNLTDGQKQAVEQSMSMTKADFTGVRKIVSFWQEVTTEGPGKGLFRKPSSNTEVVYYYVCAVNKKAYTNLQKVYLLQVVQDKNLSNETKKTVLGLKDELLKDDSQKNTDQKEKDLQAHKEMLEAEKTKQVQAASNAEKPAAESSNADNVDEALAAAAKLLGI